MLGKAPGFAVGPGFASVATMNKRVAAVVEESREHAG